MPQKIKLPTGAILLPADTQQVGDRLGESVSRWQLLGNWRVYFKQPLSQISRLLKM